MASRPIDLDAYFPFFLGTLSNRWTTTSSRIYLEKFGVGIGEWRVLASIRSLDRASSNEVVKLISMDPGAVSRSVKNLEYDGHIRPVAGKYSGRTKPYELTEEGQRLYAKIRLIALERENTLLADLSAPERRTLLRLMRKLMRRFDEL